MCKHTKLSNSVTLLPAASFVYCSSNPMTTLVGHPREVASVAVNTQADDTLPSIWVRGGANCWITLRPHTQPLGGAGYTKRVDEPPLQPPKRLNTTRGRVVAKSNPRETNRHNCRATLLVGRPHFVSSPLQTCRKPRNLQEGVLGLVVQPFCVTNFHVCAQHRKQPFLVETTRCNTISS